MPGIVTVTVPATSARLTATATARDEVGIDPANSAFDAILSRLIDRASSAIVDFCGRSFGLETVSEVFRFASGSGLGPGSAQVGPYGTPLSAQRKPLILSRAPVVALLGASEVGAALTPATDVELDPTPGLLFRMRNGYRSWWSAADATVVYQYGYVLPEDTGTRTLPFVLEDACLALVRSAWYARGRDPNVKVDMLNGDRVEFFDRSTGGMALDDDMQRQLSDYVSRGW